MSRNVRVLHCTPEDVFRVLGDGWLYPAWVVGASRMRTVEEGWPAAGAALHHSFGVWPVLIDDKTVVEVWEPPQRMVMRARGWPVGEARVTIDVKPRGEECLVRIQEEPIAGPGNLIPRALLEPPLHWRNTETLHRLAYLAEGMAAPPRDDTAADSEISDADGRRSAPGLDVKGHDAAARASYGGRMDADHNDPDVHREADDGQPPPTRARTNESGNVKRDLTYSPASERETQQKQADPVPETLDGDVDTDQVKVAPGTGGPDDQGDVEVPPEDLNLPRGAPRDESTAG